ncbi:MAG: hypothetical protein WBF99_18335 [Xanthobacteraceae bacterium]
MSGKINVVFEDGSLHFLKVTESMGYNHDLGAWCKFVEFDGREIVVKRFKGQKLWRLHTPADRVRPLRDHLIEQAKKRRTEGRAP